MSDGGNSKSWQLFIALLTTLVLGIPAGIIVNIVSGSHDASSPGSPAPSGTTPISRTHSTRKPALTPTPSVSQSAVIVKPPKPAQFLSDAQFGDTNTANVGTGDAAIDKQDYPSSVWLCSDLEVIANINCDSTKTPYWVDYNVPAGYSHFRTTLGFSADSPSDCDVTVQVISDGSKLLYARELFYGDSIPITRAVQQYLRIRLEIIPHKGLMCSTVFGNAEFTS